MVGDGLDILQRGSSFHMVVGCSFGSTSELSPDRRYIPSLLPLVCAVPGIVQTAGPVNRPKGYITGRKSIATEVNTHACMHARMTYLPHSFEKGRSQEEARVYDVASYLDSQLEY